MKKSKKTPIILFFIFCLLLSVTTLISFSSNTTTEEVLIKSITPVYDENSTIKVDNNNVLFNDKNQVVKYNVVLENTQDYDVKISDIKLSTPTEEFLQYKVEDIKKDDVISANSTKELTVSFETMRIDGWGRNFADELTANISFDKVAKQEAVTTPDEDKQPEAPATNNQELTSKTEKIEVSTITDKDIEISSDIKVDDGDKVDSWIYPDTTYIGTHEVEVSEDTTKIIGIVETLKKEEVNPGEHNIALVSEDNETLGYVSIYINEEKEILKETPQDTTDKEEVDAEDNTTNKPSTDSDNKVENPYTSDKKLVGTLIIATCITGVAVIVASKNKLTKYTVFILMLSPVFTITNAEKVIEVSLKNNVSFKSQNVMKMAYTLDENDEPIYNDYWQYKEQIKNFYIRNEISEIKEYAYKFDVSKDQNSRVMAYLVTNSDDSNYYDLYLMADGIIYPNSNASDYFYKMRYLDKIDNIAGLDTSEVTNMQLMFSHTGEYSNKFILDVSSFDTSNVTNMKGMFQKIGYSNPKFTLDVSNLDTSKVENMSYMFNQTGYASTIFELDVSNFDTSKANDMSSMFQGVGLNTSNLTLDVSKFDTSNVTNMSYMFARTGYWSESYSLNLGNNFDTSQVTDMSYMFYETGFDCEELTLDLGDNFDTSNVTDMKHMFNGTGYFDSNFNLDLGDKFDTSNVTDMSYIFYDTGFFSTKLNVSITIKNQNTNSYENMFLGVANMPGSKITVNYTEGTEDLVDKMIATKSSGSNVVKGNLIVDVDKLSIGNEIHISGEKFNVISQTDDTITMLAQYNLSSDYKQSTTSQTTTFANGTGWEYTPGPKEIDIQTWSPNVKTYVNSYVDYLKNELDSESVTGSLITLNELKGLGCTINDEYAYSSTGGYTCLNSPYKLWLVNNQNWWTRSAHSKYSQIIWLVSYDGNFNVYSYGGNSGVRPVITISKETLKGL